MEHRILREGGARDEGAAHRDGEGRAGLELSLIHISEPTRP